MWKKKEKKKKTRIEIQEVKIQEKSQE